MVVASLEQSTRVVCSKGVSLRGLFRLLGLGLFYAYMLMPFRLQQVFSLFSLEPQGNARFWGTVFPHLGLVELIMLGYAALNWILGGSKLHRHNRDFRLYVIINITCLGWVWTRHVLGYEPLFFGDSAIALIQVLSVYWLFTGLSRSSAVLSQTLQNTLILIYLATFALAVSGFGNTNVEGDVTGRLNPPGLEVTSAGYIAGVLMLGGLVLARGKRRWVMFALGAVGLALTGGRSALLLSAVFWILLVLQGRYWNLRTRIRLLRLGIVVSLVLGVSTLAFPDMLEYIPTLNRLKNPADSIMPDSVLNLLHRNFPSLPVGSGSIFLGRLAAWSAGLEVLHAQHGSPLNSDWNVQANLALVGYPSHVHNAYLQTFLKYGLLAMLIWWALARGVWRGLRARSPYAILLLFLLAGWIFDYYLFVAKSTFVFWALVRLNHDWIAQTA